MKSKPYTITPDFSTGSITLHKVLPSGEKSIVFCYPDHTIFAYRMIDNGIKLDDCSGVMFMSPKAASIVHRHYYPSDLDILLMKIISKFKTKRAEYFFKTIIYTIFAVAMLFATVRVISKYEVSKKVNKPNSQQVFFNH